MVQEDLGITQFMWKEPEGVWMRCTSRRCWETWKNEPQPRYGRSCKWNSSWR